MANRYVRRMMAVPVAVLAAIATVSTASAATTWTVQPGGPVSLKSVLFKLKDPRANGTVTCSSAKMRGTLKAGSGLPGTGIGSITAAAFSGCTGGPVVASVTASGLPFGMSFSSYQSGTGVVTGSFDHVQLMMSIPGCKAVVDGTSGTAKDGVVRFTYTNSTAKLKLLTTGGDLHFYKIVHCFGIIRNGDLATVSGTFTVSPKQTITSP